MTATTTQKGAGMRVTMAAWAFGLCFGAVVAVRIAHETHLQAFYLKGLGMDPKTVGSMWTLYFFWVGACEPIMGVVIDALRDRGVYPSTIIIVLTPIWCLPPPLTRARMPNLPRPRTPGTTQGWRGGYSKVNFQEKIGFKSQF
ncbi:hypothetical protein T484DRAFT_2977222 [Baffinella frigidus]|nr:hypothetical protein T484DRAFT_2977222 [Cryptophyta sp. CCMP2293]